MDCEEDEETSTSCVCGKENLRYLYKIRNKFNANELFPIGSTCIHKFERQDLDFELSAYNDMFKPSKYNYYNGENTYNFMLKMFNKRNKTNISNKQQKMINAVIVSDILPFIRSKIYVDN